MPVSLIQFKKNISHTKISCSITWNLFVNNVNTNQFIIKNSSYRGEWYSKHVFISIHLGITTLFYPTRWCCIHGTLIMWRHMVDNHMEYSHIVKQYRERLFKSKHMFSQRKRIFIGYTYINKLCINMCIHVLYSLRHNHIPYVMCI